jgi:hypothetical protein
VGGCSVAAAYGPRVGRPKSIALKECLSFVIHLNTRYNMVCTSSPINASKNSPPSIPIAKLR